MYVVGFIVPVPKKSVDAYRRMARKAGKIWREHGALDFHAVSYTHLTLPTTPYV